MKPFLIVIAFIWLLCGVTGAWWMGDMTLKAVARGPLTLSESFNDNPVTYPGP